MDRAIEHLGQRELRLQDRDLIAVAGLAVGGGERVRQAIQPLAQQPLDRFRRQAVANLLQTLGIGAVMDAVVERLKGDAVAGELALGVFVPVQTQLGRVRKVGTELEKERAEVAVDGVDLVVVDHRRGLYEPRV